MSRSAVSKRVRMSDPANDSLAVAASAGNRRESWLAAFRAIRAETERRAAPLSAEDQVIQSMPDASPTKWHRAHVTWFFEQFLLRPFAPGYRVFDERFAYLFNSYYVAGRAAAGAAAARVDHPARQLPKLARIARTSMPRSVR